MRSHKLEPCLPPVSSSCQRLVAGGYDSEQEKLPTMFQPTPSLLNAILHLWQVDLRS